MILLTKTSAQARQRGHTLSSCTILTWALSTLSSPPASLLLSRLSGLAATEPTLSFLHFSLFPPVSPPFSARRLQLLCDFLRFFVSLPPSPILFSFPFSLPPSPFPCPLLSSLPSPFPSPFPSGVRLRVPTPVTVPVPAPSPLPSPSPSCAPSFNSTPFPFPLRPRPHDRSRPH